MSNRDDDRLKPKDHAEAVAIFRMQVIGNLLSRELQRGELAPALRALSDKRYTPPSAETSRRYEVPTLETWLYRAREHGLDGLRPKPRSDRGYAQQLTEEQRQLLLDIRTERPTVSVPVIMRTLINDGRLQAGQVSEPTVRRLYAAHGLDRATLRRGDGERRLRWVAEAPGQLYHADVCHGPSLRIGKRVVPIRIHAILDDASRFIVALKVTSNEREVEMLELLVRAIRRHDGAPRALYLDNGSTYSGEALKTACARLGITLIHAKPYDPQARGKMERFFRTLREGCLDHLGRLESLHDIEVRLYAFVDRHYHVAPHGGLVGKSPAEVFEARPRGDSGLVPITDEQLRHALTVRGRRRIRGDGTVPIGGMDWEVGQGFLAGRSVTIARTLFEPQARPWIERDAKEYPLHPVDPVKNAKNRRRRPNKAQRGLDAIPFDPATALLDNALSRAPSRKEQK
ncbi:MAG: transposase [bacterium]|nr:transposase [bacterium]